MIRVVWLIRFRPIIGVMQYRTETNAIDVMGNGDCPASFGTLAIEQSALIVGLGSTGDAMSKARLVEFGWTAGETATYRTGFIFENRTSCPDDLLLPLLKHAAECIGVDLSLAESPIKVKITRGHYGRERIKGFAIGWHPLRDFEIWIMLPCCRYDAIDLVRRIWRVMAHEWGHVLDYQANARGKNLPFPHYANADSKRQIPHDQRPQEIRAKRYVIDAENAIAAEALPDCNSAMVNLAGWLDQEKFNRYNK